LLAIELVAADELLTYFLTYLQEAAEYDAYVNELLQETFNGNLLYLAASILAFGDDVRLAQW